MMARRWHQLPSAILGEDANELLAMLAYVRLRDGGGPTAPQAGDDPFAGIPMMALN